MNNFPTRLSLANTTNNLHILRKRHPKFPGLGLTHHENEKSIHCVLKKSRKMGEKGERKLMHANTILMSRFIDSQNSSQLLVVAEKKYFFIISDLIRPTAHYVENNKLREISQNIHHNNKACDLLGMQFYTELLSFISNIKSVDLIFWKSSISINENTCFSLA